MTTSPLNKLLSNFEKEILANSKESIVATYKIFNQENDKHLYNITTEASKKGVKTSLIDVINNNVVSLSMTEKYNGKGFKFNKELKNVTYDNLFDMRLLIDFTSKDKESGLQGNLPHLVATEEGFKMVIM